MKISIFTDSLGRPRPDIDASEKTEFEETYPGLLHGLLQPHSVNVNYVESIDTDDAIFWNQRMVAFRRPDVVVYHVGINDCAPRLFKKNTQSVLFKPWFRKLTKDKIVNFLSNKRRFFTKRFQKVYVPIGRFEDNFLAMLNEVKKYSTSARFFAVSICLAPEWLDRRSYGLNSNIRAYNQVLHRIFGKNLIDINRHFSPEELHISDGIHLTKKAHLTIAQYLANSIINQMEVKEH